MWWALAQAAEPDLGGTWRIELEVATHAVVPILGTTKVYTRQVMVASVARAPEGWVQRHDTCLLEVRTSRALAEPTIPQAFIDAVPDKTYVLDVQEVDGRWRVRGDFQPLFIGFDGARANGALPERIEDPTVVDWDGDGHPGATVVLQVPVFGRVELYQAQRGRTKFDASLDTAGALTGGVWVDWFGQRTLGASNALFAQNPTLRPATEENWYRQERLPAGTTCATAPLGRRAG